MECICLVAFNILLAINVYGLLTKGEVRKTGYWLTSRLVDIHGPREGEVHKHAEKEQPRYPAILT